MFFPTAHFQTDHTPVFLLFFTFNEEVSHVLDFVARVCNVSVCRFLGRGAKR